MRTTGLLRSPLLAAQVLLVCAAPLVRADLAQGIAEALAAPELKYSLTGVHIIDAGSGEVLYSQNADVRLVPASNQKILTTAAAWELLGPDYTYTTRLYSQSEHERRNGAVAAIYIKGYGDPSLSHEQVEALATLALRSGIRRVKGPVVADATAFGDAPLGAGWSWDYLARGYAAGISALTVDGGCVKVTVHGGATHGSRPTLKLSPPSTYLSLDPGATTLRTVASAPGVTRPLGSKILALTGPIAVDQSVEARVSVPDPPLYAATVLREALIRAGIDVVGHAETGRMLQVAQEIGTVRSAPLAELIKHTNKASDNNFAEAILRTISLHEDGVGACRAGVKHIDKWVAELGGDPLAFAMYDGSGLSRLNGVTPRLLVQVLRHMRSQQEWVDSLPIMGTDGTLRTRLTDTPAKGMIRAKTGYVSGVRALSGYVRTRSGRDLVFSILVNNCIGTQAARRMQNEVCLLLVKI